MPLDMDARHRRSIRLPGYDYASDGAYFVTIVTKDRESLLADIDGMAVCLTDIGKIVEEEWVRTAEVRAEVELDAFVVMPNHVHGIVVIAGPTAVGAHGRAPLRQPEDGTTLVRRPRSLGALVAGFKSACTTRINALRDHPGVPVWQRNYYDRIIRNEAELNRTHRYILDNPAHWHEDPENPAVSL